MPRAMIDDLPVVWSTKHEIVVVKPAGMATELTSDPKGVSLLSRVQTMHPDARLPHRLDRVTRGLVVVALTDEAIAWHNAEIRDGAWEKIYLACVHASADLDHLVGTHKLHLRTRAGRADVVRSGGKRALTEILAWAPATARSDESHILIRLHTGRYHQIRATMAHLGAPLVDDWIYGTSAGRACEHFYLEHVALRFRPTGKDLELGAHWHGDPAREAVDPVLGGALDSLLAQWTQDGVRIIGGADAEER